MIVMSYFIYLTYSLYDKNIPEVIGGQGHVMRRNQSQM